MALYPFKFRAQLLHKIWGGHTIEKWYDHLYQMMVAAFARLDAAEDIAAYETNKTLIGA